MTNKRVDSRVIQRYEIVFSFPVMFAMRYWLRSRRLIAFYLIIASFLLYKCFTHYYIKEHEVVQLVEYEAKETTKQHDNVPPVYLIGAYLIRDDFLRVILITDCRFTMPIYALYIDGEQAVKAAAKKLSVVNDGCPYKYGHLCLFDGKYAEFEFPAKFRGDQVAVEVEGGEQQALITIRKSLPPKERAHRLAVCVPALFYYSDTIQLIGFLENWLLAGATKFLIYWQAVTQDVRNVLHFYKENGIDLELIAWPRLTSKNADLTMYYSGQVVSINDCLHRARSDAEFAAAVDLDELIALPSSKTLIAILSEAPPNSPGMAITRVHAHYENLPPYANDPKLLSFAPLNDIHCGPPGSALPKMILRPENVMRGFVHWINEAEPGATNLTYILYSDALLVHLRSMQEVMDERTFIVNHILQEASRRMTDNWSQRLHASQKQLQSEYITRGVMEAAQAMEACLLDLKGKQHIMCFTASHCISHLVSKHSNAHVDWQYPEKKWIEI